MVHPPANTLSRWILAGALGLGLVSSPAASGAAEPRLVRVSLGPTLALPELLRGGFDIVEVHGAREARILAWPGDEARLAALGAPIEVLDEHPGRTAALRARQEMLSASVPGATGRAPSRPAGAAAQLGPPPVGSGSMGGYWTTAEIKMKLDDLVANDPNDLVADKIDTLGATIQGRPVWGLMLGRHRSGPGLPPVAFFNSLTHAREPGGMQALFYFVDDLLSHYGSDPFATYLLEKRRIYIVPLVNPDGYLVNEGTYFGSGGTTFGFWRKNVRDNHSNATFDPDSDGVDLNRNYGFKWGYDDLGSSPDVTLETYRGPGPFSEPESRVQRDVVDALQPKTGLSFHTYRDLELYPWGYDQVAPLPDSAAFLEWTALLTRDNAYLGGESPEVLYPTNGEFNDWCYGDTLLKPRAYTWTPEIGSDDDGFWPPPSRIVPLAQENLRGCYVVAALAGAFVQADGWRILEGALNASYGAHLSVRARNLGVGASAGPGLTGTLTPLDAGVRMLVSAVGYPTLGTRQTGDPVAGATFEMVVADTVTPGRLVRFRIDFADASGLVSRDTLVIPLGMPTVVAFDNATSGLAKWTPGSWGIVAGDAQHPSPYFTDSPGGNYQVGADNSLLLNQPLDLSAGVHAYAQYGARWEFEEDYDSGSVEASRDGTAWTRLPATGTTPGSGTDPAIQPLGQPVYAGSRRVWKHELADLSAFTGAGATAVRFRLRVRSDIAVVFDGLSVDSVRVVLFDPAAQPALVAVRDAPPAARVELEGPAPNPAASGARFVFAVPQAGDVRLSILDLQGRQLRELASGRVEPGRYVRRWDLADGEGRPAPPGIYFARLEEPGATLTRRFAVIR